MSATTWFIIAIVGFSLSGIALAAAIFMFIKMNIPAIIGDLTGKTVVREIKAMREANISSGDKRFRLSKVNLEQGTPAERFYRPDFDEEAIKKAHVSKRLDKATGQTGGSFSKKKDGTAGLAKDIDEGSNEGSSLTEPLIGTATEVLSDNNAAEILDADSTEVLDTNGTGVLFDDGKTVSGTTVLSQTEKLEEAEIKPVTFKIIKSKLLIHSDEVI
ncbi:MAG TPA: hypothetical protein DD413_04165 [Ruminococcus sp.]|nr:hypothetical protein [Ruminococcus sp.]